MNVAALSETRRASLTQCRLAATLLFLGVFLAGPVWPNGWEHRAIPLSVLLRALQSEDPAYRARAALSLGIKRDPRALSDLVSRLARGESEPAVRANIYRALGRIGESSAAETLVRALKDEQYPEARAQAALALGDLADMRGLDALVVALSAEKDARVIAGLVSALGAFSDSRAVKALVTALKAGDPEIKRQAIQALGRTGSAEAVKPLLTALAQLSGERHLIAAIDALAMIGDPRSRAPLEDLLINSQAESVRTHVVVALGAIRDGSTVPALIGLLDTGSLGQRYLALVALADLGDPKAVQPVTEFYRSIAQQLDSIGPAETGDVMDLLVAALRLQGAALRALLQLDPGSALYAFLHGAKHRAFSKDSAAGLRLNVLVYQARRLAVSGLGYEGSRIAFDALTSAAIWDDPDPAIRAVATRAVAVSGQPDAIDFLLKRIADPQPEVRWTAASVLGRLTEGRAEDALRLLLTDVHSEVRRQAVLSLAYLNALGARADITRLAETDPAARVRITAGEALKMLSIP